MSLLYNKRLLLAKVESTYGVDSTPTGTADTIQTIGLDIQTLQGNRIDRGTDSATLGQDKSILIGQHVVITFSVELSGSGTAGDEPAYAVLLLGCGFEATDQTTYWEYTPVSTSFDSLSMYFNVDGQLHIVLGARGNVEFVINNAGLPVMNFTFTGLYSEPTDTAQATPVYTGFTDAIPVSETNTPTFTVHGYSAIAETFSCNMNNAVNHRNVVNSESVIIQDRAPSGTLKFDMPTIAAKDFYDIIEAGTTGAVQVVHGITSGNIIQVDAPAVQLETYAMSDSSGITSVDVQARYTYSSGNDEFKLTTK